MNFNTFPVKERALSVYMGHYCHFCAWKGKWVCCRVLWWFM